MLAGLSCFFLGYKTLSGELYSELNLRIRFHVLQQEQTLWITNEYLYLGHIAALPPGLGNEPHGWDHFSTPLE
jgi:hypothetical protein